MMLNGGMTKGAALRDRELVLIYCGVRLQANGMDILKEEFFGLE